MFTLARILELIILVLKQVFKEIEYARSLPSKLKKAREAYNERRRKMREAIRDRHDAGVIAELERLRDKDHHRG